jgi:GAF domain-containing protein
MRQRPKPLKPKAKLPVAPKSPKNQSARVRDLEKRLAESLEQQTATSEILRVISSSPTDVQPVFEAMAANAARLCDAFDATIFLVDSDVLRLVAHKGPIAPDPILPLTEGTLGGRVIRARRAVHVDDLQAETREYPMSSEFARNRGFRTTLCVPLLRGAEAIGMIAIRRTEVRPFTDNQITLLQTFANQAVIAIENVRLFSETKEALDQQTATSEILRVISQSPTDVQPVFDAVAENAARLCEAFDASIYRREVDRLLLVAKHGPLPVGPVGEFSLSLVRGTGAGRAVLDGRTVHVADMQNEANEFPESTENARRTGFRTILVVPLMREGAAIGTINLRRTEVQPFTERQVALLQTFADQAVIAIENVRLFKELEARNRAITESLEQQTATAEILRVISSSPTDTQPVLDVMAESAARLCEAADASIFRVEGDRLRLVAQHGAMPHGPSGSGACRSSATASPAGP